MTVLRDLSGDGEAAPPLSAPARCSGTRRPDRLAAARVAARDTELFWRWQLLIAAGATLCGALVVAAYALATPEGPHRHELAGGAFGAALLAVVAGTFFGRPGRTGHRAGLAGGCGLTVVGIMAAAALDGGQSSPLVVLLVLPVLLASVALPPTVVGLVAVTAWGTATVLPRPPARGAPPAPPTVTMVLAVVGVAAVASAVNRHYHAERVQQLALRDSLTGCLNRRAALEALDAGAAWAARQGVPLAVMMVDLDHFKAINDHGGHAAGDRVLRAVARVLVDAVRPSDTVGRLGGDEFVLVLPDTDAAQAARAAARVRQAVAAVAFSERPTVSVGTSVWVDGPLDTAALLAAADVALYRAKARGRDRHEGAPGCEVDTPGDGPERRAVSVPRPTT